MNYIKELGLSSKIEEIISNLEIMKNGQVMKLITNIKNCANDRWGYVNSFYDGDKEFSLNYFLDVQGVFDDINTESGNTVFVPGGQFFGESAEMYLKNTRFAGKEIKNTIVLYYVAKLYEEAVDEIELDDKQKLDILNSLIEIKQALGI